MKIRIYRACNIETLPIRKSRCKKYAKQTPIDSYRTAKELIADKGRNIERISLKELVARGQNTYKGELHDDNTLCYRGRQNILKRTDKNGKEYFLHEKKQHKSEQKTKRHITESVIPDNYDIIKLMRTVLAMHRMTAKGLFAKHYKPGKDDDPELPLMTEMVDIKVLWNIVDDSVQGFPIDISMPSIKCKVVRTWATELAPDYFRRAKYKTKVKFRKLNDGDIVIDGNIEQYNDIYFDVQREMIDNTHACIMDEYRYDFFFDGNCRRDIKRIIDDVLLDKSKLMTNICNQLK